MDIKKDDIQKSIKFVEYDYRFKVRKSNNYFENICKSRKLDILIFWIQ